ncbi:phospholipase DDHD1 isoform X2 [Corythoichthys intestinalis]|uniref:phospholipase DDHD1 isoform X2 n=1 Tax=Corythoichthys intestinalis TaxID=161448 RepID=UPI0025A57325|nr:phospholipase DDHD1 isoform X2 [Corythoichthys intestinalis]XP_061798579.1 phospholipase DDHD1-like [Nerophis lumbriciformis]
MNNYDLTTRKTKQCSLEGLVTTANNNNKKWHTVDGNGCERCHDVSPMDEAVLPGMSSVQTGLDALDDRGGLRLLEDLDCSPSGDVNGDGPLFERRKRSRSNSSRHHFGDVVAELGPEEVRWFYKEDKKTWKPFVGHDSLNIELMYRKFCEFKPGTASPKVEDQAVNGELSMETRTIGVGGDKASLDTTTPSTTTDERDPDGIDVRVEPVCVRGGLYEVDVIDRGCYPVYWKQQDHIPVLRGQWFIDGTWLPLEEDESDLIESEHLSHFRGQQKQDTFDASDMVVKTVDSKDAIHSLKLSRTHVDWHSVDEVYLYSDATTSKIARTVTQKLGFSKASSSGTRLHRGYVEEASPEDRPPQTTHIVFVVHGIGQKMDQGRIIKNTGMLREGVRKMEEKHFSEHNDEHVEFLPVEWRSKLALDGDTVDSITPDKLRGLRDLLNSSAMDIMYYNSPLYRDEITKGLTQELNRLYSLFCSRNPEFEERQGKVSIVSHSLGCVITYDIMTGWDPVRFCLQEHHAVEEELQMHWTSYEERHLLEQLRHTRNRLRELENQLLTLEASKPSAPPALKFKVENFFCMGSPLAVFLALRGIRPGTSCHQDHILPTSICSRLFNVFHPTDPVAYRLEPLILKHYNNVAPVQIHWCSATNPAPYDEVRPTFLNLAKEPTSDTESIPSPSTSPVLPRRHYGESITNLGKASILGAASIGKGIGGILFSRFSRSNSQPSVSLGLEGGSNTDEDEQQKRTESQSAYGLSTMTRPTSPTADVSLELERRIDFELREGLVESRYWSAVTSHTGYWCSHDIALFLLTFIYEHRKTSSDPGGDTAEPD